MAERAYRVLLLEDDQLVLDRVHDRLGTVRHAAAGDIWWLEFRPVRIGVEKAAESYSFERHTLDAIAKAVRDGIDLVVMDYGYVHPDAWNEARASAAAAGRTKVSRDDLRGRILTTEDLAQALREYATDAAVGQELREAILQTFFGATRRTPTLLYSYTSAELYDVYQSVEARKNRTESVFPTLSVEGIDTKAELYNTAEFDWPAKPSKHDPHYYSFLVSGLLVRLVRERFIQHLLQLAEAPQYLRVRRSLKAVSLIVASGAALGLAGEWLGNRVLTFATAKAYGSLLIFSLFALTLTVVVGLALPVLFERLMQALLRPDDAAGSPLRRE